MSLFGCRLFGPISWICKKETLVFHSSTESEVVSLDAVLRKDRSDKSIAF